MSVRIGDRRSFWRPLLAMTLAVIASSLAAPDPAAAVSRSCTAFAEIRGQAHLSRGGRETFSLKIGGTFERRESAVFADTARFKACREAAKDAAWKWRSQPDTVRAEACKFARKRFRNFDDKIAQLEVVGVSPRKNLTRRATVKNGRVDYVNERTFSCAEILPGSGGGGADRLGHIRDLEVLIKTGRDDLRGNSKASMVIRLKGHPDMRVELNKGKRWRDGSTHRVVTRMPRSVGFADIAAIEIRTELYNRVAPFNGTDTGDNWNVDRICVVGWNRNERAFYIDQKGYPLFRFKADSWDVALRGEELPIHREKSKHSEFRLPLPWPKRVSGQEGCR